MKYAKPPLSIKDQIDLLVSRGMEIPDRDRAYRYLSHISYFRLRGYWIPFENSDDGKEHHFKPGTSFDSVLELYIFDRKFRLLMLEAIERVEISFRAHFANELGVIYGSHFYLNNQYSNNSQTHHELIDYLQEEIDRSTELFIEHYKNTYDDPPLPPIWAAAEVMSFGQLSTWLKNLKSRKDRNRLAHPYGIDEVVFQSFMHHLTIVRNITAHHGRLWNRRMVFTIKLPKTPTTLSQMLNKKSKQYIGNTVIILGYFLRKISPETTWPQRMRQLIEDSPGIRPAAMGFDEKWKDLPLWQ